MLVFRQIAPLIMGHLVHTAFKELYPDCSIIPKMHYMENYPDWIHKYASTTTFLLYNIGLDVHGV